MSHAASVHSLWTLAADAPKKIPGPHIEYAQLAPVLIVLGAALLGVLVEAFLPRRARYHAQVLLTVVGLAAAFASVVALAVGGYAHDKAHVAAMGAVAVDGLALFLQGTVLLVGLVAVFTFAERRLDPAVQGRPVDSFAAQAGAVPGGDAEQRAVMAGFVTTEVFPVLLFAIGGMLVFPAANDLLTLFVALEVFSLPLYVLCALARRQRLLSQEAAVKYFLLGAFSSAFLLFGVALLYGYAGTVTYAGIADVVSGNVQTPGPALADTMGNDALLLVGGAMVLMGLLFKVGAVPFHMWTPDVYQGAPHAGHRLHGRRHQGRRLRRAAAAAVRRPARHALGLAAGDVGRRDRHHARGRHRGRHPDRCEAAAGLLLHRPRGVHPRRCHRRQPGRGVLGPLLSGRVLLRHPRRVRGGHAGARRRLERPRTCPSGPGSGGVRRWWPRSSRSFCWPSRASR
ncbi:hypothetical protein GCM10020000_44330 [Streptomyces olivoverticillatus]